MEIERQNEIEEVLKEKLNEARNDGIVIGAKTLATLIYSKLEHITVKSTKVEMARAISDVKKYIDKARFDEEIKQTKKSNNNV